MKKQTRQRAPRSAKTTDRASIILNLFREFPNNKFSLKQLASVSGGASKEGRRETLEILGRLFEQGVVEECSREKYRLTQKHLPHYEGVADMTSSGAVYVRVEGLDKDIFVNQRATANALDGDRVEVVVTHRGRDGRMEGEVTRIVERNRRTYVGVAEVGAHQIFVKADSRRMPMDIYLSKRTCPEVRDGEKVVVRIVDWQPGSKSPAGELVERLGMAGNNDTEMHAILAEYELPYRFEPEVEQAAAAIDARITAGEIASRRDFRNTTTFTVDPADAKDFDDALSVRKVSDGVWEVGVHIADVTHYVRPPLDDRRRSRRTRHVGLSGGPHGADAPRTTLERALLAAPQRDESLFLGGLHAQREPGDPQRVVRPHGDPLRPPLHLCRSAGGDRDRPRRLRRGDPDTQPSGPGAAPAALPQRGHLVRPRGGEVPPRRERQAAGRLLQGAEGVEPDDRGVHAAGQPPRRGVLRPPPQRKGRAVPRTMVFRVHDSPSEEKLDRFRQFILRFGHVFKATKGRAVARELNKLFAKIKGSTEENAVSTMAVRSMAKAFYTTDNIGHYGLAFPYYTHFTSPIRRYPDMMVHRLLAHYLDGGQVAAQGGDRGTVRARLGA